MTKARRTEGPRAPLFYSAAFILCASAAVAQSIDLAELEECAGLTSDVLKLECYEAVVERHRSIEEAIVPEAATAEPPIEAEAAPAVAEAVAAEVTSESAAITSTVSAAASTAVPDPAPESASPDAPMTAALPDDEPVEPGTDVDDDFGREHLPETEVESNRTEVMTATVVQAEFRRNRGITFHLDNGQVWQQENDRYFQYPKNREFDVEITQGMMGDYQLRIGGEGRMVRIRRVR